MYVHLAGFYGGKCVSRQSSVRQCVTKDLTVSPAPCNVLLIICNGLLGRIKVETIHQVLEEGFRPEER